MLLCSLLLAGVLAGQPAQADRAEAERLARSGAYAQALEKFRQLAAANPEDIDARIWIGRLHNWMGRPHEAEPVFRSVIETNPDRVEALVGLGVTLTALHREREAIDVLSRAEKIAPNDPDVLAAQGRAHYAAGHNRLAEAYLQRAALLRAGDREIHDTLDTVHANNMHAFEARFVHESFSFDVPDTRLGNIAVDLRATDRLRVLGRVDVQRKFLFDEARGGGGVAWQALPRLTLRGMGLFGGTAEVLPRGEVSVGFEVANDGIRWMGEFRYFRFDNINYWVFTPGFAAKVTDRAVVSASYSRSATEFPDVEGKIGNNSGRVGLDVRVVPRLWIGGGYARNVERLDTLSPDRLGEFRANTGTATGRFALQPLTTLGVEYEYQRRPGDVRMIRLVASLVQRF